MIGDERWKFLFDVDNLTKIQIIQLVYLIIFAAYLSGVKLDPTLGGSKNKTIKKRRTKNTKRKPKKQAKKQNKTKQTRKNKTRKSKK
jgi:F420-0:gamma-glutamyl ligase-like protein